MERPQPHYNPEPNQNFEAMRQRLTGQPQEPTQEELAEWGFNGCMICGAPTGLMVTVEVVGQGESVIATDGSVSYDDLNETARRIVKVYCSECGAGIWER